MIAYLLALDALAASSAFLLLVAATGWVGSKIASAEFSWVRYGAFLFVALVGAVLMLAATSTIVFLAVAVALVAWVLLRAAADAQATTLREKIGFVQLYLGLCLVEFGAMGRSGALDGLRASASFAFTLNDVLGHLLLPLQLLVLGGMDVPSWASPASLAGSLAASLAGHWLLSAALTTFATSAFVYAYFAEHATPKVGLSLLPAPTAMAIAFAIAWLTVAVAPQGSAVGLSAGLLAVWLTPFFVAEGLWVVRKLVGRVRTIGLWMGLLASIAVVSPGLVALLSFSGWTFHLVRLRSFQPILGDVERSAARPRLRTAFAVAAGTAAMLAALGAADAALLGAASPRIFEWSDTCNGVTMKRGAAGVTVTTSAGQYVIDEHEQANVGGTAEELVALCRSRGARLCTSDEWALACTCSYPEEARGGSKVFTNDRLTFRRAGEQSAPDAPGAAIVRDLLSGGSELVAPELPGGALMSAGPSDGVDDPWTVDCRYRALLPRSALTTGRFVGVRCCR